MAVSSLIAPLLGVGNAAMCLYMMYLFAVRVLFSDTTASNAYAQFYPRECRHGCSSHGGAVCLAKSRKPDRSNDGYLAAILLPNRYIVSMKPYGHRATANA